MGFILSALLYLFIAILVLYAYLEYSSYQKVAFYTRQGIHFQWKPIISSFFSKNSKNTYEIAKELTEVNKGQDVAITNIYGGIQVCPLTPKALKEFFDKEQDHTSRVMPIVDAETHLRKDGELPIKARAIFKKLYTRKNLPLFKPMVIECLRKQIQITKQKVEAEGGSLKFSLHEDFMLPLFDKMATRLAFGDDEEHLDIPELGHKSFYGGAKEYITLGNGAVFNILNLLSGGLYVRLGLSKTYKQHLVVRDNLQAYVDKVINIRCEGIEKGQYTPKRTNIVDFLILENAELRKAGKQPHTKEEICLHILDVFAAGVDTILGVFESLFGRLVFKENRKHFKDLKEFVKKDFPKDEYSIDSLLDHPYLHPTFEESSRIFPGLNRSFSKKVTKRFKLCGIQVKKGDDVAVRYLSLNHNKEHFPNPDIYDPSRFAGEKKVPRFTFMQFGQGVRSCVGRTFGDFMVKTFFVELLKEFDFDYDDEFKPKWFHFDLFSGMIDAKMIIETIANN